MCLLDLPNPPSGLTPFSAPFSLYRFRSLGSDKIWYASDISLNWRVQNVSYIIPWQYTSVSASLLSPLHLDRPYSYLGDT